MRCASPRSTLTLTRNTRVTRSRLSHSNRELCQRWQPVHTTTWSQEAADVGHTNAEVPATAAELVYEWVLNLGGSPDAGTIAYRTTVSSPQQAVAS